MKKFNFICVFLVAAALITTACNKNNPGSGPNPDPNPDPNPEKKGKYILLTAEQINKGSGYYAAYDELPTGDVDNIGGYSLQARSYGGFRVYKNWIFNRSDPNGNSGVISYEIGKDGRLTEKGFIKCDGKTGSAQNIVINDNLGFYYDSERGKTKIQKFNPSTMQRTGEIDLSSAVEESKGKNVYTGNQTLAYKEGKLFVSITYSRDGGSGHNDNTQHYTMAVVNVATEKIEKTIVLDFDEVHNQGHSPSEYPAWLLGDDGNLYFLSTGWGVNAKGDNDPKPSCIFRIKKGETDFDKNWTIKISDLNSAITSGGLMWSMGFYKGKLFIEAGDSSDNFPKNYLIYTVDIESKKAEKMDIPITIFGHSAGTLYRAGDRLFIRVVNEGEKFNGLYIINEDAKTASPAFNVVRGGQPMGFTRLVGN